MSTCARSPSTVSSIISVEFPQNSWLYRKDSKYRNPNSTNFLLHNHTWCGNTIQKSSPRGFWWFQRRVLHLILRVQQTREIPIVSSINTSSLFTEMVSGVTHSCSSGTSSQIHLTLSIIDSILLFKKCCVVSCPSHSTHLV